ncbi:FAD-dependent oxidoreductase [Nocardiopsis sp. CT-R113]|uniref:FAD-dependent oxidoreductase n=1 Tax=Nocardiopsis codii TaxID=3065942 RepID=A0ABU7KFU1_9ACTN|nr:FAD-dependent oxidoreductase [Nocardiopsis sp. CT-R113]MEE2041121.1 FAD-dependent oxidoreductase [Nocardiopsis sp. CT-R113]
MREVTVIGGGIIGAATAWRLTLAGARVTVLEREPAPARGTSAASFSRATAFGKAPRTYFELNRAGVRELHRLHDEGVPGFRPCPSLVWGDGSPKLAEAVAAAARTGYEAHCAAPEDAGLPEGADRAALPALVGRLPAEGWVDLPAMAVWMLDRARDHGAEVRFGAEAAGVRTGADGAVLGVGLSDGGLVEADVVVNAAGARGQEVAALVGGPLALDPTLGLLADLPLPGGADTMLLGPDVSIRPAGPDSVLVRSDTVDARLGADHPSDARLDDLVTELVGCAAAVLPRLSGARPEAVRLGTRAYPADGHASVGFLSTAPGYYEAVTHSGATLGPLLGRLAAAEILSGRRDPLLTPFTPDRFLRKRPAEAGAHHATATQ